MKTTTIIIGALVLGGAVFAAHRLLTANTSAPSSTPLAPAGPDIPANGDAPAPPPSPVPPQHVLTAASFAQVLTSQAVQPPAPPLRAPALTRELVKTYPSPPPIAR